MHGWIILAHMQLPDTGFLRLHQIIGCSRRKIPAVIPVSRATWFRGVADGRYPAGVMDGGIRMWRVEDIRAHVERVGKGVAA